MNISVHLPDSLAQRLDEYLERESTTISRDALIAKCIQSFLDEQQGLANGWSKEILALHLYGMVKPDWGTRRLGDGGNH